MSEQLTRSQRETAPGDNDRCWLKRVTVFTAKGAETLYVRVFEFPASGLPCEVYLNSTKTDSQADLHLKSVGRWVSRCLQFGVTLPQLVEMLEGEQGFLSGSTDDPNIPLISSAEDLLAKALKRRYFKA